MGVHLYKWAQKKKKKTSISCFKKKPESRTAIDQTLVQIMITVAQQLATALCLAKQAPVIWLQFNILTPAMGLTLDHCGIFFDILSISGIL